MSKMENRFYIHPQNEHELECVVHHALDNPQLFDCEYTYKGGRGQAVCIHTRSNHGVSITMKRTASISFDADTISVDARVQGEVFKYEYHFQDRFAPHTSNYQSKIIRAIFGPKYT